MPVSKYRYITSLILGVFLLNGVTESQKTRSFTDGSYHNSLLQKLSLLIPNIPEEKPYPQQLELLSNLLNMIRFLALKLSSAAIKNHYDPKVPQYQALRSTVDEALQSIQSSGSVSKNLMNIIANQMAQLFQETPKVKSLGSAPLCEPGNDCFEDVNHLKIRENAQKLAQRVTDFIGYRKKILHGQIAKGIPQEVVHSQLAADSILADSAILINNLHRAVMRNWHHILMIIGNLVGSEGGSIHMLGHPENSYQPMYSKNKLFRSLKSTNVGSFQCKILIKGKPKLPINKNVCDNSIQPWFRNKECATPIKSSASDCSPSFSGGRFKELQNGNIGFEIDQEGDWDYKAKIILEPNPRLNISRDFVVGRIDKLASKSYVPKYLVDIRSDIFFDTDNNIHPRSNEVVQEGTGYFKAGDTILLRLAKTRNNLSLLFTAELATARKKSGEKKNEKKSKTGSVRSKESVEAKNDEELEESTPKKPKKEENEKEEDSLDEDYMERFRRRF